MLLIAPGQVIHDTYRIEKLLGSGGMADVYLVTHCRMPRQFALKVMHAGGSASAQFLERFQREAKILAQLRHSHIVDVIDHNTLPDGRAYLVMDLLDGEDLSSYLSRHDGLPLHVALQLCHQIGDALAAAHAVGITHRDLKPSNIFICNNGPFPNFVRILDFGIAKVSNQSADMAPSKTHTAIVGTPGYMAPEQVYGRNDKLGPAADQFALAAILYEMLSGRAAFYSAQDSVYAIMSKTVSHDPPELELGLPQLREAIKRALSKEPEDRFPSIQQFLAATGATSMTVVAEPSSPQRVPPSTLGERQGEVLRSFSRRRFIQSVALTVLCAIAAGSGVALLITHPTVILNRSPDLGPVSSIAPSPPAVSDLSPPPPPPPPPPPIDEPPRSIDPPDSGKPDSEVPPPVPRKPAPAAARSYSISGVLLPGQSRRIHSCLQAHLGGVSGLDGSVIHLERSGSLQIVDAPAGVRRTALDACLQQAFLDTPVRQIPQSATIRISHGG